MFLKVSQQVFFFKYQIRILNIFVEKIVKLKGDIEYRQTFMIFV